MDSEWTQCLSKLADEKTFHSKIDSKPLAIALARSIIPQSSNYTLLQSIEKELRNLTQKSVYSSLKYLIFIHQTLQWCRTENQCSTIKEILSLVELSAKSDKYEEYFRMKLLIPYLQYLIKLAQILQLKLTDRTLPSQNQQLMFLEFNLLIFTSVTFITPIKQFTNFLKQFYPFLGQYPELIAKDAYCMLQKIKSLHPQEHIGSISFVEIQQLSDKIYRLLPQDKARSEDTRDSSGGAQDRYSPIPIRQITAFDDLQGTLAAFV